MSPLIRNILAFFLGILVGSIVNMGIISISGYIIPPPNGADITSMEGLKSSMYLFKPINFLFPFLAHAIGTFAGAFVAVLVSKSHSFSLALAVSIFFLIGGVANVILLPSPLWFAILDIVVAYLPFGYIAARLINRK